MAGQETIIRLQIPSPRRSLGYIQFAVILAFLAPVMRTFSGEVAIEPYQYNIFQAVFLYLSMSIISIAVPLLIAIFTFWRWKGKSPMLTAGLPTFIWAATIGMAGVGRRVPETENLSLELMLVTAVVFTIEFFAIGMAAMYLFSPAKAESFDGAT